MLSPPKSLIERVERLETRERLAAEWILLHIELGIRDLDTSHFTDHKQFLATAENLISQVTTLKG